MWREKSNRPRSWIAPSFPLTVHVVSWVLGAILLAFVALPLIGLATTQSKTTLAEAAMMPDVRGAIALSLEGALLSALLAAMFGVPLGYVLARSAFPGKNLIGALIDIPLAVPHTVAGIALLIVFGRRGILGGPADQFLGLRFWGTIAGIVVAMLFVSAPYTVNAARLGFEAVDPRLEKVARTLGMGPWRAFLRVTLPLSWRSILTGLTLTYARSVSEFAAVVVLVYYPMTAPVQIYEMFLRYGLDQAAAPALLLLLVTLALFALLRAFAYGRPPRGEQR